MAIVGGVSLSEVSKSVFAGMMLARGNEVSQVLVKVLKLSAGPITEVRIGIRFINIAAVRQNS